MREKERHMSCARMNGGKRSRPRSPEACEEKDENSCPNPGKRARFESKEVNKAGTVVVIKKTEAKLEMQGSSSSGNVRSKDSQNPNSSKRWSLKQQEVQPEVLEDIGIVELDEEASFDEDGDDLASPSPPRHVTPDKKLDTLIMPRRRVFLLGNDPFARLSDEMVLMVFGWLPKHTLSKAAQVCKRWRQLAYDDSLWPRLDLGSRNLLPRNLEHVLRRGVSTLRLASSSIPDPVIKANSSLLPSHFVSKLQFLDLTMAQISKTGLYELLHTCRNLRKLSLENCALDDACCEAVAHNASLEMLNLASCSGITSSGLESILACCTSITSLNLAWTSLDNETINTLCVTLPPSIQRLSLAGCRKILSDSHVRMITNACRKLLELDLSDCTTITAASVSCIVEKLEDLDHLSLSRCYSIHPSAFETLNEAYSLTYVDLYGILSETATLLLKSELSGVFINKFPFSAIARPTVGTRRTSIWGIKVRD